MFEASAITGKIGLNEAPALRAMKNVEKEAQQMKQGFDRSAVGMGDSLRDTFKGLKGDLGKNSLLGQGLKLAAGGGAIAGLSMAAHEINAFSASIVEMKNDYQSGALSAGQLTEKVMASLPVLGQFWQVGRNIREMFMGEEAAALKATKAFEMNMAASAKLLKEQKEFVAARDDVQKTLAGMRKGADREATLLHTPQELKGLQSDRFQLEDDLGKVDDARKEIADKVNALKSMQASAAAAAAKAQDKVSKESAALNVLDGLPAIRGLNKKKLQDDLVGDKNILKEKEDQLGRINKQLQAEIDNQTRINKQADATAAALKGNVVEKALQERQKVMEETHDLIFGKVRVKVAELSKAGAADWRQLPNPRLPAEELFGPKRVTSADLPQPYVNIGSMMEKVAAQQDQKSDKANALLQQIVALLSKRDTSSPAVTNYVMSLP